MHGVPGIFVLREESLTPRAMQRLAEDLLNLNHVPPPFYLLFFLVNCAPHSIETGTILVHEPAF